MSVTSVATSQESLALISQSPTGVAQVSAWLDAVSDALSASSLPYDDAATATTRAQLIRRLLVVTNSVKSLIAKATRVELLLYRHLGKLSVTEDGNDLKPRQKTIIRVLRDMGNDEFNAFMSKVDGHHAASTCVTEWEREKLFGRVQRESQQRFKSYVSGTGEDLGEPSDDYRCSLPNQHDPEQYREAARVLLQGLAEANQPFSVAQGTAVLAQQLGVNDEDMVVESGLRDLLYRALRETTPADARFTFNGTEYEVPSFVTYYTDSDGWIHLPWECATVDQLSFMADLRAAQARELEESARRLRELVEVARSCKKRKLSMVVEHLKRSAP
jgi:hypothetical protein